MKIEVEYKIEEFTRFRIVRHDKADGVLGYSAGGGWNYGEFSSRRDAEKVKEALEMSAMHRVQRAL